MPGPRVLDFANVADAAYMASDPPVAGFARLHFGQLRSGFKGSVYRGGGATIIAFAGTDGDETEQTDIGDKFADLGFAGSAIVSIASVVSPALGRVLSAANAQLRAQLEGAVELAQQGRGMAAGGPVYLTGHSLGGGLAQLTAARLNIPGVSFNAPAVSQMGLSLAPGVRFVNVMLENDPVSALTRNFGRHLGHPSDLHVLNGGVSVADAHFMSSLTSTLSAGRNSTLGLTSPF